MHLCAVPRTVCAREVVLSVLQVHDAAGQSSRQLRFNEAMLRSVLTAVDCH